ncbi:MAG: hypothetical protein NTW96_20915 [Planctomycetia bacterium]|nr:hypothetical protein [Planctomycetia bacterium]
MQSSTTVLCRAVVMLTCLVVVPLLALFGTSLPQMARTLLDRPVNRDTAANQSLDEAPAFAANDAATGMTAASPPLDSPRVNLPDGRPATYPQPGTTPAGPLNPGPSTYPVPQPGALANRAGGMVPVGYNAPVGDRIVAPPPWRSNPSGYPSGGSSPGGVGDAGRSVPAQPAALVPVTPSPGDSTQAGAPVVPGRSAAGANVLPAAPSTAGAFLGIQERLRGMGATYYRLESWGSQQPLFRFQCEMALDESPHLTRHFEATDGDPLRAMSKVLAEVEVWKAGR